MLQSPICTLLRQRRRGGHLVGRSLDAALASIGHGARNSFRRTMCDGNPVGSQGPCSTRARTPALPALETRNATRRAALMAEASG